MSCSAEGRGRARPAACHATCVLIMWGMHKERGNLGHVHVIGTSVSTKSTCPYFARICAAAAAAAAPAVKGFPCAQPHSRQAITSSWRTSHQHVLPAQLLLPGAVAFPLHHTSSKGSRSGRHRGCYLAGPFLIFNSQSLVSCMPQEWFSVTAEEEPTRVGHKTSAEQQLAQQLAQQLHNREDAMGQPFSSDQAG